MPIIAHTTGTTVVGECGQAVQIDTVLIKVVSRCNINCSYCYVFNMGDDNWSLLEKSMSEETIAALCTSLAQLRAYQEKPFSVVLHGGEPLLLGAKKLALVLGELREHLPNEYPISIQTNGLLITNKILDVCSDYCTSIAVSLDGPLHVHNKWRVKHNGQGSFDAVMCGIRLIQSHPDAAFLNAGLLAVIDPLSNPVEVYQFFKRIDTPSVDFLYRDGNHTNLPYGKKSFHSTEYGAWMTGLLDVYLADQDPLPIRILDDMLKVILGGTVSKEGIGLTDFAIIIVDTDGSLMKNDTLKSSFNGADKFAAPVNIKDGTFLQFIYSLEFKNYLSMQKNVAAPCNACPELAVCGGGMILHRWSSENAFDNTSVYCNDQIHLINHMRWCLMQLVPQNHYKPENAHAL